MWNVRVVGKRTHGTGDRDGIDELVLHFGGSSASGFTWQQLLPYRIRLEGIQVLRLEGLLKMKEKGRLKDQADAEQIRKMLVSIVD